MMLIWRWLVAVTLTFSTTLDLATSLSANTRTPTCSLQKNTVLYGPGERVMLLLTAKLAAREMDQSSLICEPGAEEICRLLMYGKEYADKGVDEIGMAKPISDATDMEDALKKVTSIIFIGHENPLEEKSVDTLLNAAGEELSNVVLLSKMGATKATKGGFFGIGGGGDSNFPSSENYVRQVCKSKGANFSIVRAGVMKGGGSGDKEIGKDLGLNEAYYNTLLDIVEASVTMAHDKYTMGADCTLGDTIEMPNMFTSIGTKSSFEPYSYDTNRITAAGGVVAAALKDDGSIEFSISAAKAEKPPSPEEWKTLIDGL